MNMIHEALRPLGIGKKESDLYRKLLSLGPQPASVLARKMNIPRSSTQFLAESLVQKDILRKIKRKNSTYYHALPPEELPHLLKAKKEKFLYEIEQEEKNLNAIIALLQKETLSESHMPQVSFFEGLDGLQNLYESIFSAKEDVRSLVNFEDRQKHLPEYFNTYYQRRKKEKIFMKAIYPDTKFGRERQNNDKEDYRTSHLVDTKKYFWLPEIQVYDNKVSIACGSKKIGIIIEGKEIADAIKVLFDLAWEGLERKKKTKEK